MPPEATAGRGRGHCVETFGVSFIDPVNTYTLSDRATKYGMLFIALTFLGVGLAASAACTVLLGFYVRFVLHGVRAGLVFGSAAAALYGVLFVLLQLEQRALLLGSLLLFAVLAALRVATRRIDWYALLARIRGEAGTGSP